MSAVKENLLAAKAQIDTPEKFEKLGGALNAINDTCGYKTDAEQKCIEALQESRGLTGTDWSCHAEVIARFDRAIAAQDDKP